MSARSPKAPIPRLALTSAEAAAACGVSQDYFVLHIGPELRWVWRGRKKLVAIRELDRWFDENASSVFGEDAV